MVCDWLVDLQLNLHFAKSPDFTAEFHWDNRLNGQDTGFAS